MSTTLLRTLGLHRRELRAWAMYDWANSAFTTTIVTAVFPVYFTTVAAASLPRAAATRHLATITAAALAIAAITAPVVGALADAAPIKKKLLGIFVAMGAGASAGLFFVGENDWPLALILFGIGNVAFSASLALYDSLLPHLAAADEIDRVSTAGYAMGYLGGGVLLAMNVAWIIAPGTFGLSGAAQASRVSFLSVAIWWAAFSIPLFVLAPEPPVGVRPRANGTGLVAATFSGLLSTLRRLRRYKQAFLLLVAFVIYSDGINTIIRLATSFGAEIGLAQNALITAILLVQFVGIPFSFLFGLLAGRIGAKAAILLALAVYTLTTVLGYFIRTERDFYLLALMVASVQGGSQALSRSLFASMIPRSRSSEFFGFFSVFEKLGAMLGPLTFALANGLTGSSRAAILTIVVFFAAGALLLSLVDVPEGQRAVGYDIEECG
jgi:UMF1 family MFS transporter